MLKYILVIFIWAVYFPSEISNHIYKSLKLKSAKNESKGVQKDKGVTDIENSIMRIVDSVNIVFDPVSKKFIPSNSRKSHIVGGFSQNIPDEEDVEKSKFEKALRFFEKMKDNMMIIGAKINSELDGENFQTLEKYTEISAILRESLATMHSLDVVRSENGITFSKYTTEWYAEATLKDKYDTKKSIQKEMKKIIKKEINSKKVSNKKIDASIEQLELDLLMQKFVIENTNVTKLLKEHSKNGGDYLSPMHTDVCGQLGSILASYLFEKTFKESVNNDLSFFKKYLPLLKFRIQTMIQNGTLLLLEKDIYDSLHSFKKKIAELMDKKFGFNDMCPEKCLNETVNADYSLEGYEKNFKPTNTLQRRGDLTRLLLYYYRDKLFNIEATADFILIMLLYLNSATEVSENGFLDVSIMHTSDKYNLINKTIDKSAVKTRGDQINIKKIAPFNFFREESLERSGNEPIFAIDDIIKTCSLLKRSKYFNSLFELTRNLWVDIQNMYSASYGFTESKKIKIGNFVASRIRNVGFLFRWFSNNKPSFKNTNFLVRHFSPLLSISLQLTFFICTMIEQYTSSFLRSFSAVLKKIFTLGRSGANPKNYDDLIKFSETNYLLKHNKVDSAQRIISQIVTMLKKKFLSLPYTPTLLAQFVSTILSLWVFENEKDVSLQNSNVSRFKKLFFLTYFVHNDGPVEKAVDIIYNRCKSRTKKIVLGCIHDYGGIGKSKFFGLISRKCKPTRINVKKRSIRKILKVLMSSLSNPLDILKIAVDTATRCDHFYRSPSKGDNKKNKINYDLFIKSELSLRYICATVTKKIVQKIIKDVSRLKDMNQAQSVIDKTLNSLQYLKIKNHRDESSSITIICPFMEGNDKNIRDLERSQITYFVFKNIGMLKILKGKVLNLFKKSISIREGIKSDSSIFIKVGARKFNGLLFTGGYHLNVENSQRDTLHIDFSESRMVYDGRNFVDELSIIKEDGVKKIEMKGINEGYQRIYVLQDGTKVTEFDFGIQNPNANIIVFDGFNYISSRALSIMGLNDERLVWAGDTIGWTAEFALSLISESPVPIFDGHAWVLLDKLSVKSILGEFLPNNVDGNLLASNVNFVVLNKKGKQIMIDETPIINLKYATLTLAGILNFVTKAEKGKGNQIIVHTRIP